MHCVEVQLQNCLNIWGTGSMILRVIFVWLKDDLTILCFIFLKVVRLCREHGLYGALIYLFNQGLNDYRAPLEELLLVVQNSPRKEASRTCYRMLVYLKYCFQGLAFPPGFNITWFSYAVTPCCLSFFFFFPLLCFSSIASYAVTHFLCFKPLFWSGWIQSYICFCHDAGMFEDCINAIF